MRCQAAVALFTMPMHSGLQLSSFASSLYGRSSCSVKAGLHEMHAFSSTVAPVMFGKPLLNNVLAFDHVLLQK